MSERTAGQLNAERTHIHTEGGTLIASTEWAGINPEEAFANAAFIALAWNAHDALLAACVEAVDQLRFYDGTATIKNHDAALIASLDAAIAKAKP